MSSRPKILESRTSKLKETLISHSKTCTVDHLTHTSKTCMVDHLTPTFRTFTVDHPIPTFKTFTVALPTPTFKTFTVDLLIPTSKTFKAQLLQFTGLKLIPVTSFKFQISRFTRLSPMLELLEHAKKMDIKPTK